MLDNPHVAYAHATPFEIAAKLCELVERPLAESRAASEAAAASVQGTTWDDAGAAVVRIVEDVVAGARSVASVVSRYCVCMYRPGWSCLAVGDESAAYRA